MAVAAAAGDPNDDLIGVTIAGRYRIISRLGAGGMGVAYRAWDERDGVPVVIKIPKKAFLEDPKFKERFYREIRLLQGLNHRHIGPITDVGEHEGVPFVVLRFLPGGSLSNRRLRDNDGRPRPNPASMLHLWLPAVAEALDYVHSQGVVHRDVKPANIFFDAFWGAYLGDFGIAKVVEESDTFDKEHTLTATHMGLGTPEYMAPEQFTPKAAIDGKADQYALAVMVYEILAGSRPFTGATSNLIVEVLTHPVPSIASHRRGLPASLVEAVHKGLAKNPAERFPTCREFAAAVLRDVPLMEDEPGVARLLCPQCANILKLPTDAAGQKGKCPKCQSRMTVAADLGSLWLLDEARKQRKSASGSGDESPATPSDENFEKALETFKPVSSETPIGRADRRGKPLPGWAVAGSAAVAAIALMVPAISLFVRGGGPQSQTPTPAVAEEPTIDPSSAFAVDEDRIAVSSSMGWTRLPRSKDCLVKYQPGPKKSFPKVLVTAAPAPEGFAEITPENHNDFAAAIAAGVAESLGKSKPLKKAVAMKLGDHLGVAWGTPGSISVDGIQVSIERWSYAVVIGGRMYTVEARAPKGKIDDAAKSVAKAMAAALAPPSANTAPDKPPQADERQAGEASPSGGSLSVIRDQYPREERELYLSDIPEGETKVVHFGFGKGTINGAQNPIRSIIDGKESPHGLSMHPGDGPNGDCFVKYSLPSGTKRFLATATLDQGGSFDHCGIGFEVIADGKSVWKSKAINKDNRFQECDVAIGDCRSLELRTNTVTAAFGGHAVWIEPRITVGSAVIPDRNLAANREAALWALKLRGSVDIKDVAGKRDRIDSNERLPASQFVVVGIGLPPGSNIPATDFSVLRDLQGLESLGLGGIPVNDVVFDQISDLPNLKHLGVNWTQVTGAGLAKMKNSRLVGIDVGGVRNIMPALQRFKAMGTLESINFDRVDIPPEGFLLIGQMKTLKQMWFRNGLVPQDQLDFLRKELPKCNILLHQ